MAAAPIFIGAIKSPMAQILPGDAQTLVTLWTPGSAGSKINAIGIASTDTAARDIQLYVTKGGVDYLLCTIAIPINSGNVNNVPAVDPLAHANAPWIRTDENGAKYLLLESGAVLKAKALTTVTAAKAIQFAMSGGDF
jgi:hypothetical protein